MSTQAAAQGAVGPRTDLRYPRLWWGLFVLAQLIWLAASLLPLPIEPPGVAHWDKWGHLLAYIALAGAGMMICRSRTARVRTLVWLCLLGLLIEGLQGLTPWRSMEAADLLANVIGIALGSLVALTPLRDALVWLERGIARPRA